MRKVFLDDFPRWRFGKIKTNGEIDWKNCIGFDIKFIYDNIQGIMSIVEYDIKKNKLLIAYKDYDLVEISTDKLLYSKLRLVLRSEISNYDNYDESKSRRVDLKGLPLLNYKNIDWNRVASNNTIIPFVYDNIIGELQIVNYEPNNKKLHIKYKNNDIFKITTVSFITAKLGGLLKIYTPDFKVEIGQIFKDGKRNLTITDKEYRRVYKSNGKLKQNQKWYKYTCNKCGWIGGWIQECHLLEGNGCSCCSSSVVVEHINSIVAKEETQWMIKYFQGGYDEAKLYTPQSSKRITPKCPECGRVKDNTSSISDIYKNHSIGCNCSDKLSYPFKVMFSALEQLNIEFETEVKFNWCRYTSFDDINKIKTGRYDFIIPNIKYIIEIDGGFHKNDNKMNNTSKEESQYVDFTKDKLAKENGYEVIRINCEKSELEFIKQNIINELCDIFNLSDVDWIKCEKFALSNRIKEACNYWNSGFDTAKEISNIMKLDSHTIVIYLNKGTKLGWCNYNGKLEASKNMKKVGKACGKQVEIFRDGVSLGIYPSCAELSRQSEKLFGFKLTIPSISTSCTGKRLMYKDKGLTFKYIIN